MQSNFHSHIHQSVSVVLLLRLLYYQFYLSVCNNRGGRSFNKYDLRRKSKLYWGVGWQSIVGPFSRHHGTLIPKFRNYVLHHRASTSTPSNDSPTCTHQCTPFVSLLHRALNPDIAGDVESKMGMENACSFQSLGYYLSTGFNFFLQDATCRQPSAEDDSDRSTVVNFVVYCR